MITGQNSQLFANRFCEKRGQQKIALSREVPKLLLNAEK
jgi:hypothetical protein